MKTYYLTSDMAKASGIHPNTVRLYEELGLLPKAKRRPNGYRMFTDFHMEQIKLARTALEVEMLQNGLRQTAIAIVRASASGDLDRAIRLAGSYLQQIKREQQHAGEAIAIVEQLLSGGSGQPETAGLDLTRKETADLLHISIDTLRNWEMNGLLAVKRKHNGYRMYTESDVRRLKIIRSLRCANYSLAAVLRMLNAVSGDPQADIRQAIDTPREDEDIISACDRLLTSLRRAERNALDMLVRLEAMINRFRSPPSNPTL